MNFFNTNGKWNVATAPVQVGYGEGQVPMVVAEEAHKEYAAQGHSQSLARMNERGGFGASELAILLYQRIKRLEAGIAEGEVGKC